MNNSGQAQSTLHDLLHLSGSSVLAWLDALAVGSIHVPAEFNWLGLAEAAAAKAHRASDRRESLAWAYVAERAYQWWTQDDPAGSQHTSTVLSLVNLWANLIVRFGPMPDEPMLDFGRLKDTFYRNLPFSYEEACQKATNWPERPLDEVRCLRRIKNLLGPIARLVEHGLIRDDSDLGRWLHLRPKLP